MGRRSTITTLLCAVAVTGCGSSSEQRTAPPPKLPAAVADSLASRSDAVVSALAAGNSCGALTAAQDLQQEAITAINSRRVPAAFQEQLASTVNDLVSRIRCVPVEQPHDKGKHKGRHKKKKHGEEND